MSDWPELPIAEWRDTCGTLHLYAQIVGKIRLALAPAMNHWWQVPLYVTTRGLSTSPMPYADRLISIDFDFLDHRLVLQDTTGRARALPLEPRAVCDFYAAVFAELAAMDVRVTINTAPQECPVTTPLSDDAAHAAYDPAHARRFWHTLTKVEPVFQTFRARYRGKSSPVQLYWGGFDLGVARYSGRRVTPPADPIERLAFDEQMYEIGFWPGDPWGGTMDAGFFALARPVPAGWAEARVQPAAAQYAAGMQGFVLPYAEVRRARDPAREILEFAQSTYERCAELGGWDRAALAFP